MNIPAGWKNVLPPAKLASTAAIALVGMAFVLFRFGEPLERLSYDLPFPLRTNLAAPEIVLICMNEEAARQLHQTFEKPWDRKLHAQLVNRLTDDGAKLVVYDVVFQNQGPDAEADDELAKAIQRNGHVILSGAIQNSREGDIYRASIYAPLPLFRLAAAGWGVAILDPDPDLGIRELQNGTADRASTAWVAAEKVGAEVTKNPDQRLASRWINYFGPSGTLREVSFHQALYKDGVAPGFFKDKIVVIGRNLAIGGPDFDRDQFRNPYSRWHDLFSPGVEVHATEFLNLTHGNWLRRFPPALELTLIVLLGLALGISANYVSPKPGIPIMAGLALALSVLTIFAFIHWHVWWNWLVPVLVQTPLAILWCATSPYILGVRLVDAPIPDTHPFKIAISYRREDTLGFTGRLYDRLEAEFGREHVFMDFDSIPTGADFPEHIRTVIGGSKALVAVIGPQWLGQRKKNRRIDDQRDFVRQEIACALQHEVPIIPVLVDKTVMPNQQQLPSEISALALKNALTVDAGMDFNYHANRLIKAIRSLPGVPKKRFWSLRRRK